MDEATGRKSVPSISRGGASSCLSGSKSAQPGHHTPWNPKQSGLRRKKKIPFSGLRGGDGTAGIAGAVGILVT